MERQMSKIGRRECHLTGVSFQGVESLVDAINAVLKETISCPECSINVSKNLLADCGVPLNNLGVLIEVEGPNEEIIRAIDLRAVSKVLEICEKRGITNHTLGPLEIV